MIKFCNGGLFITAIVYAASREGRIADFSEFFLLSAGGPFAWITLALGILVFIVAMIFDMSDPHRVTRRSANGFWLHIIAAPALVNTIALTLLSGGGMNALLVLVHEVLQDRADLAGARTVAPDRIDAEGSVGLLHAVAQGVVDDGGVAQLGPVCGDRMEARPEDGPPARHDIGVGAGPSGGRGKDALRFHVMLHDGPVIADRIPHIGENLCFSRKPVGVPFEKGEFAMFEGDILAGEKQNFRRARDRPVDLLQRGGQFRAGAVVDAKAVHLL